MRRILFLNINFPPSTTIGTQRIIRIAKYLDPLRWDIFVLTLKEKYYNQNNPASAIPASISEVYRSGKIDPLGLLVRLRDAFKGQPKTGGAPRAGGQSAPVKPASNPGKPSPLRRIREKVVGIFEFPDKDVSWLPLAVLKGVYVILKHDIDVIYSSSPSHSQHLVATWLKKLTGRKLVLDFRDPWARSPWLDEERSASASAKRKARRIQRLERWVVSHADQVVFVTRPMRDDFIAYYQDQPAGKFKLFYNGYDPDNIALPEQSGRKKKSRPFVLVHTGTLYKRRDPTPILEALKKLLDEGKIKPGDVEFRFIGTITEELRHVPALVDEMGLKQIASFLPPVTYKESFQEMSRSDVLTLLQPITRLQIPGKFFDYICFEKPLFAVCEPESAVEVLVKDHFGVVADINRVEDIADKILQCREMQFSPERLREEREKFDMSKSIRIFDDILDSAIGSEK